MNDDTQSAAIPLPEYVSVEDIVEALRSARVDIAAYEAEQAGQDFDPAWIEIDAIEIAGIREARRG